MAVWPCMICDQRFSGEAWNVYLQRFERDEAEKYRFVCCPACGGELLEVWRERALWRDESGEWLSPTAEPGPKLVPVPLAGPARPFQRSR